MLTRRTENEKKNESFPIEVKSVFPKRRQDVLNLNGWGFTDSYFYYDQGKLLFSGDRYPISKKQFKDARRYLLQVLKSDLKDLKPYVNKIHKESDYPPAIQNPELVKEIADANIEFSLDFDDRFFRCRGQASRDFYVLRFGKFDRIPDLVVWPKSHEEVVFIVKLANKYCSCIIPVGGATNITQSLTYSKDSGRNRFFISLDTSLMNKILWIDRVSMVACIESGIAGKDLEDALGTQGLTMGHEPDSIEFSTLGGWIATRSSGMKQQTYGNIEDIVVKSTLVTSTGVIEKNFLTPRCSIGPDYDHIILGSEGTLGVITKAVVKVHNIPQERRYGSIMFPDFERGTNFMYEISKWDRKPSNLRLVDSIHFNLGQALRVNDNVFGDIADFIKAQVVQYLCTFDLNHVSLATYLIEGDLETVEALEQKLKDISIKYLGLVAGPKYGKRAYMMTFADLFFDMGFLLDSVEPAVSWTQCWPMINTIKQVWEDELKKRNIFQVLALRISQIYNGGVCVYFYYGIGPTHEKDQLETFEELTNILREAIIAAGGNLSHHHGVGKKTSKWYPDAVSRVGVEMFHAIKSRLDPNNVFDVGNLVEDKQGNKL